MEPWVQFAAQLAAHPCTFPTSRIFFAQYMRMKPCILPQCTISSCAAFHSLSCVAPFSNCSLQGWARIRERAGPSVTASAWAEWAAYARRAAWPLSTILEGKWAGQR